VPKTKRNHDSFYLGFRGRGGFRSRGGFRGRGRGRGRYFRGARQGNRGDSNDDVSFFQSFVFFSKFIFIFFFFFRMMMKTKDKMSGNHQSKKTSTNKKVL